MTTGAVHFLSHAVFCVAGWFDSDVGIRYNQINGVFGTILEQVQEFEVFKGGCER